MSTTKATGAMRSSFCSATFPRCACATAISAKPPRSTIPRPPAPIGSGFVRTPFAGNQIPANRWDPIAAKMINAYPSPTSTGRFNNYLVEPVQNQNWNQGDVRVDHQISSKDNFFARYSIQNTETIVPSTYPATTIPGISGPVNLSDEASFAGTSFQPAQHAVASYARIITPTLVNEFRVGFNRYRLDYTADQFAPGAQLGNQAWRSERQRHAAGTEPAHLLAGELPGHRPDAFASHFPAREHVSSTSTT